MKTRAGRFFEDFRIGDEIQHSVPRTVTAGDAAVLQTLYPSRFALYSSDEFARHCGFHSSPLQDLAVFHIVFGKSVPDISLNAVANLGYAQCRWLGQVWVGDTLTARSKVIGKRPTSNGKAGVVWVRTSGVNQHGAAVIEFVRWVLIPKRDPCAADEPAQIPRLAPSIEPRHLILPVGFTFTEYDFAKAGSRHRWGDYAVGERIDHVDAVTLTEAEHMMATRLWQNTARVHFDATVRPDGRRLIYGGHVMSLARALSFNGLANAQMIVALNAGTHANPCFAGDTVRAWSEVLDRTETPNPSVGVLRLRLIAVKSQTQTFPMRLADGSYAPDVLLDLDYWALLPT
ncbi:MaoC family dehydratase [Bradyrhizobium tunisiense]|uniref:MaoC family dehydratase n=1 Tax=Bradyrhizobium tunisiense TaxID=3278709 RepID=UPI0035DC6840